MVESLTDPPSDRQDGVRAVRAAVTKPAKPETEVRLEVTVLSEPRDAEHEALLRLLFGAAPEGVSA